MLFIMILLIVSLLSGNFALAVPADEGSGAQTTTKVLLKKETGTYLEVIHVVVRGGTQKEIGYKLGKAGIEEFNSILLPFADATYGEEKELYIKGYDDVLYERMLESGRHTGSVRTITATMQVFRYISRLSLSALQYIFLP
jgi:deoxyxylulose-5-phosphate synthase